MGRYTKSRYTKVGVCIWSDDRFRRLSPMLPGGQSLWLYLITCPYAESIPGLIPMGRLALAEALNWSIEDFDKAFDEIRREGMAEADWPARLLFVPKAVDHNPPGNVNILKHWFAELEKIPDSPLKQKAISSLGSYCQANGKGFSEAFAKAFPKAFGKALPEAFGNSNSNSNSNSEEERRGDGLTLSPLEQEAADLALEFWNKVPGMRRPLLLDLTAHFKDKLESLRANGKDEIDHIRKCIHDPKRTKGDADTLPKMFKFWQFCGLEEKEISNERRKSQRSPGTSAGGGRQDPTIKSRTL